MDMTAGHPVSDEEGLHIRSRGRLPHWEARGSAYFITFRLADSLPAHVLDAYLFEREDIVRTAKTSGRELTLHELQRLDELHEERIEAYLDAGNGSCWLSDALIAGIVKENLLHFGGTKYCLIAWCIMPNHVHAVVRPLQGHGLTDIVQSYTAKKANELLRRTGAFWQREYYDHLVRDQDDYERVVHYTFDNPRKAGLTNWPWVG